MIKFLSKLNFSVYLIPKYFIEYHQEFFKVISNWFANFAFVNHDINDYQIFA
jgi:hypothetical protein